MDGSLEFHDRLAVSLEKAFAFLTTGRNKTGFWSDFLTLAGESELWVSGYVGYALAQQCEGYSASLLNDVGSRLFANQNVDGGWSYGLGVPSDGDSTSWCLLFLSKLCLQSWQGREKALGFLLRHQNRVDGGFRTYAKPADIGRYMKLNGDFSFEGWSSSQMCVTAVAVQALLENDSKSGVDEALDFIRAGQTAEGFWLPYWWSGKLYATVHCMEALNFKTRPEDAELLYKARRWIVESQLQDGGWSDSADQQSGWAFSTALALSGLMLKPDHGFWDSIRSGVGWLVDRQLADGSWASNHILRIPYPWTKDPWNQVSWREDGKAVNSAIRDHRRLFTTATVFAALKEYESLICGGELH